MNDGCNGCKYEDTPCIIRICGNAPGATAEDIKTLEKCTMLNKIEQRKRGQSSGKIDSGRIQSID